MIQTHTFTNTKDALMGAIEGKLPISQSGWNN